VWSVGRCCDTALGSGCEQVLMRRNARLGDNPGSGLVAMHLRKLERYQKDTDADI